MFGPTNKFRKFCWAVSHHLAFKLFVFVTIIAAMFVFIIQEPLEPKDSTRNKVIEWINLYATIVFVIEALIKIVAQGFACNYGNSYLKDSWNVLDFFITFASVLDLITE